MSVAFDTVNHQLLLNCLKYHVGFQGMVLQWLQSYLTGHTQKNILKNAGKTSESTPKPFKIGICIGFNPFSHCIYFTPRRTLCNAHGIHFHCYADDTQLHLSFRTTYSANKQNCIHNLETCISEIWNWMSTNLLKLNASKTEFTILGTRQQLKMLRQMTSPSWLTVKMYPKSLQWEIWCMCLTVNWRTLFT